jgi:hypothetical protein
MSCSPRLAPKVDAVVNRADAQRAGCEVETGTPGANACKVVGAHFTGDQ